MAVHDIISFVAIVLVFTSSFAAIYWIVGKNQYVPKELLFSIAWRAWGIWLSSNILVFLIYVLLDDSLFFLFMPSFWRILLVLAAMFGTSAICNLIYLRFAIKRSNLPEFSIVPFESIAPVVKPPVLLTALGINVIASLTIVLVLLAAQLIQTGYRFYFPAPEDTFGFYDI